MFLKASSFLVLLSPVTMLTKVTKVPSLCSSLSSCSAPLGIKIVYEFSQS